MELKENGKRMAWFTSVRDFAFVVAIAGGAWAIATAIADVRVDLGAKLERNTALIERNAEAIERNAKAIERNAEAIERNAKAIERNAKAIERNAEAIEQVKDTMGELERSVAGLAGQFAEHVREHEGSASR